MEWLLLSAVLWLVLLVAGWRWRLRRKGRKSLCRNCQYDYLDICDLPHRPYARECDTYLPIEDVEYEELDEAEDADWH
jgi:hypothetical protein